MRYIVRFEHPKYGPHEVCYHTGLDRHFGRGKAYSWARWTAKRYGGDLYGQDGEGAGLKRIDLAA